MKSGISKVEAVLRHERNGQAKNHKQKKCPFSA